MHGLLGCVIDAEIDEVVGQMRAGEELGGEVADDADVLCPVVKDGLDPALDEAVADGVGEGHVEIVHGGAFARAGLDEEEIVEEGMCEGVDAGSGALTFKGALGAKIGKDGSGHEHLE